MILGDEIDEPEDDEVALVEEENPAEPEPPFVREGARDGTWISVKLDHPIVSGAETLAYIDFRRGQAGDAAIAGSTSKMSIVNKTATFGLNDKAILRTIERMGGLASGDAMQIDSQKDYPACKAVVMDFFPMDFGS